MNELVFLKKDEAMTDSLTVAEMFEKRHDNVMKAIEKVIAGLLKIKDTPSSAKFYKTKYKNDQNGEWYPKYLMNYQGFSLLVMGFTGEKAFEWKVRYEAAFSAMAKVIMERNTDAWLETRRQGMITRKDETNVISDLVEYAKNQGSEHSQRLYVIYTKLANKMVGITSRDAATNAQLNELSTMERIIANVVLDGMAKGKHYKEIYQDCKRRLETVKGWLEVA